MDGDDRSKPSRYRLAWRWRESGVTGMGPWTRRSDLVEAWMDSLSQRHGETVVHWIEVSADEPRTRSRGKRPRD
jgi:hypothetical protein